MGSIMGRRGILVGTMVLVKKTWGKWTTYKDLPVILRVGTGLFSFVLFVGCDISSHNGFSR